MFTEMSNDEIKLCRKTISKHTDKTRGLSNEAFKEIGVAGCKRLKEVDPTF